MLEAGAGTGRVTRLLLGAGASVVASEPALAMLNVARRHIAHLPAARCALLAADALALPVRAGWADVAIAGWVLGHLRRGTRNLAGDIARALAELDRALRPGGTLVVIETLGTGEERPRPPAPRAGGVLCLARGRTGDGAAGHPHRLSLPPHPEAAARATGFFFGGEFPRVRHESWSRIPECTGLWWRRTVAAD